jgi:hypothetical protein
MFAMSTHEAFIELEVGQEVIYRLPPMSAGPIIIHANHSGRASRPIPPLGTSSRTFSGSRGVSGIRTSTLAEGTIARRTGIGGVTSGTVGEVDPGETDTGPARDLSLELTHSNHYSMIGTNYIMAESQWHDDRWRLRIKRGTDSFAPTNDHRRYKIIVMYYSQLPIIERPIPVKFFQYGFDENYNKQKYVSISFSTDKVLINFQNEFAELHGLQNPTEIPVPSSAIRLISKSIVKPRLSVGVRPLKLPSGKIEKSVFLAVRADVDKGFKVEADVKVGDVTLIELPPFTLIIRFYLTTFGTSLYFIPEIQWDALFNLIDNSTIAAVAGISGEDA